MRDFELTHPFHPYSGKRFALISHWRNWGEERVVYEDPAGRIRSLPTAWTSLAAADPFVRLSAGRSLFRTEDLVALVSLIRRTDPDRVCKEDSAGSVNRNTSEILQDVEP